MIVTEIYPGSALGNQLWWMVVTRVLAEKNGYDWGVATPHHFRGRNFMPDYDFGKTVTGGHSPGFWHLGQLPASLHDGLVHYYQESIKPMPQCGNSPIMFDENLWNNLSDNTKIDGYFQCMGYIKDRKDDIRGWLSHNVNVTEYSDDDICVIHFRGGEYLVTASWCPPEYYANARDRMLEINPNMKFVVVTDDPANANKFMPWAPVVGATTVKEQDPIEQGTGFYQYKGGNIGIDYSILNNAKNVIMSASTFSFWPVWTSPFDNNVIAPKYWFDYKTSDGWWRGVDSIVDEWLYIDTNGVIMSGVDCKEDFHEYRKNHEVV